MKPKVHCRYDKLEDAENLKPHPRNPRTHPEEEIKSLANIIKETGWRRPVTVSKRSGYIVRGHGALEAAKVLGCQVPVEMQNFRSDAEEHAHMIADNRLAELAAWNDEQLSKLLSELDTQINLSGFDQSELDQMLDIAVVPEPKVSKAASLLKKWKVKRGQLWEIGEHRLLCGDALDADNWSQLGGPFNFCFADPPYDLSLSVTSLKPATKCDLLFMSTDKVLANQNASGFRQYFCYTFKSADSPMWTTSPWRKHNLIGWWNWRERKRSFKGCTSWINHEAQNQDSGQNHEQAKPVELPEFFIRWFSRPGERIADAFSGSGSTIVAAHLAKRIAMSVEISPESCAVILERLTEMGLKPRQLLEH